MTKDEIKAMVLECGAMLTGQTGGYVYADQLLKAHLDQLIADGWRQCAKGQRTSQFCGQLEAAVKAEREACADLCDSLYPPCNDPGDCAKAIRARSDGG